MYASFGLLGKINAIKYYNLFILTLLHSEMPKLYKILAFLSAVGFK